MTNLRLFYITTADEEEALAIGRTLVSEHLAACVNILPNMRSVYRWEGAVQEAEETVLLVKAKEEQAQAIRERVVELHSYDCPCIVELPITGGFMPYLNWVNKMGGSN